MEVFITHKSALQFWRTRDKAGDTKGLLIRERVSPANPPVVSALITNKVFGLSAPIEVTVSKANSRRASKTFKTHHHPEALPGKSMVRVSSRLLVASPELCFFQLANELPFVKLVELGYELCGTYTYALLADVPPGKDADECREAAYNYAPITNTKKLSAFVAQMPGKHGKKNASKALQYIVDGSASPKETELAILLVLPFSFGGYGFSLPEMNRRIDPKAAMKKDASKEFYKCDLYWKDSNLAVEYDSILHHSGYADIASDSIKRGDLALSGVAVITVTNEQLNSAKEFDKVARNIASKTGRRIQIRNPKFKEMQSVLRKQLLNVNASQA